ncbi:MAG: hypothetical protein KAU14_01235 [Thermoplasmata archaeon]|nr:hypothetical protein [Thermoplasmata archaeon]
MHDVIERDGFLYNFDEQERRKERRRVSLILMITLTITGACVVDIRSQEDLLDVAVVIAFFVPSTLFYNYFELKPSYFTPEMFVYQPDWSFKQPIKINYEEIKEIEINYKRGSGILDVKCKDKTYTLVVREKNLDKTIAYLKKIKKNSLVKIVK